MRALSPRENEVMGLVIDGLSNPAIAHRLGIKHRTVVNHVYNIYRKIGVNCRSQAVAAFVREDLQPINARLKIF